MPETAPLIPKPDRKKDDHSIFLRVCHSPWDSIGQQSLVTLRSLVMAYLFVTFFMILDYQITRLQKGWIMVFELPNISYLLQLIYHTLTFSWTFMHLYYPHHASQTPSHYTRFQKLLSPPRQNPNTQNRTFFSIFYTAVLVFPFMSSLIYWAVLVSKGDTRIPTDDLIHKNWFTTFYIVTKYGVNCLIPFIEILVLSSIKQQTPTWSHITGLITLCCSYVGWVFLGFVVVDEYAYFFFDHRQIGWEYVTVAIVSFSATSIIFFALVYWLADLRERFHSKCHGGHNGYQQLPQ